jgi:hypothetical protein
MPVDSTHAQYNEFSDQWSRCRDTVKGTDAVKGKQTRYLPILGGQDHREYDAYLKRALFFAADARTVQALVGSIFRKEYILKYPERLAKVLDDITDEASSLDVLLRNVAREVLTVGRTGVLVDASKEGETAYITQYQAENIVNWLSQRVNGQMMLVRVVLREKYDAPVEGDPFAVEEKTQYRVLSLTNDNALMYKQFVYRKMSDDKWHLFDEATPTIRGVPLDHIPFKFVNAFDDEPNAQKPPLVDLCDVNVSHYRTSADLEHGAHFTALPTPVLMGFDPKNTYKIGSGTAWITSNPQADAKYLEYTGQGLESLRDLKKDKEQMMAVLGARMLEEQRRGVETAETHKLRSSGESGALAATVGVIDNAMTQALKWHAVWLGATPEQAEDIELVLNKDFISARMTGPELIALMQARQSGEISQDTFLSNLKTGEILPDGVSVEDEKDRLEVESNSTDEVGSVMPIKRAFDLVRDKDGKPTGIQEA